MKDTPADIEARYHEMLMRKTGTERLRMGFDMYDAARELVMAGLQADGAFDLPARFFLRFYGNDFTVAQQAVILERIRAVAASAHQTPTPL